MGMHRFNPWRWAYSLSLIAAAGWFAGCSAGEQASGVGSDPTQGCEGRCADSPENLSVADVEQIVAQAVGEARALGVSGHIAVSDRVGNVLGVFSMTGSPATIRIATPGRDITAGLEGVNVIPAVASAITKANTAAYVSSEGNAFSTRVASQIIQEHFNPGEFDQPGGPLFGVQISQLPCSDLSARHQGVAASPGPHRSPLGMSADPGGFPLYRNGTVIGGVGVEVDGAYGLDTSVFDTDRDVDELVALAATFGFAAPLDRRADRITVEGKTLRFSDVSDADLLSMPATVNVADALSLGSFVLVRGYTDDTVRVRSGTAFGQPASGIRPASDAEFAARDAFMLVDAANQPRFAPRAGTGAGALSAAEVRAVMLNALDVANSARAQIRRPLSTPARVSIFVTDRNGDVLGAVRSRDAPIFGIDVALQKARTVNFFSGSDAASALTALPDVGYLVNGFNERPPVALGDYVAATRALLERPTALADGQIAFGARTIGNLARPFLPDGIVGAPPGPLSKPMGEWSVFSTGLQVDLVYNALVAHVAFLLGAIPNDVPQNCTGISRFSEGLQVDSPIAALPNGVQIFSGGVPIYRGNQLVGAIGISGDGIEQDDMIAFLGLHRAGEALGGAIGNAPVALRADQLVIDGQNPRYVQCPQAPFIDSDEENVCAGK